MISKFHNTLIFNLLVAGVLLSSITATSVTAAPAVNEPLIGGPCEGCENVFVGQPAKIEWRSRIAETGELGEALIIAGTVQTLDGKPASGIIVYAYQTDKGGVYPRGSTRHGRLRGWARTNDQGQYRFDTIRPGAYPGRSVPQHVHFHVIEPGKATYYITDLVFDDDPLLTKRARQRHKDARGGNGIGYPKKNVAGIWQVRRDIVLGENIPGYRDSK